MAYTYETTVTIWEPGDKVYVITDLEIDEGEIIPAGTILTIKSIDNEPYREGAFDIDFEEIEGSYYDCDFELVDAPRKEDSYGL